MFAGKNILVGVTGGIAVYKTCDLVRELVKASAQVRVVMTESACRFVQPLTFETLTGHSVLTEMFPAANGGTVHIDWARWPNAICICPATANTISKIANGLADNVLTTTILATTAPVVICPAMNKEMYANPIYQANQEKLLLHGYRLVSPGLGELACGEIGWGRLAEKNDILDALKKILLSGQTLQGKKVLITAGPTHEPLDPVRFLGNRSSGKMGYALAEAAVLQGAQVTLISGPTVLHPFPDVHLIRVQTAQEMADQTLSILKEYDIFISSAAVGDFRPAKFSTHKIKKEQQKLVLSLVRTPDILERAAEVKGHRIHVGFSVETENETAYSQVKLEKKNLDLIVINNPMQKGAGFEVDTNIVTLLDAQGRIEKWPLMSKRDVATKIIEKIVLMGSC
jgi:phosphopantothenoylcysteine decarboxylase / phosphopantothenate---cysteine ligase